MSRLVTCLVVLSLCSVAFGYNYNWVNRTTQCEMDYGQCDSANTADSCSPDPQVQILQWDLSELCIPPEYAVATGNGAIHIGSGWTDGNGGDFYANTSVAPIVLGVTTPNDLNACDLAGLKEVHLGAYGGTTGAHETHAVPQSVVQDWLDAGMATVICSSVNTCWWSGNNCLSMDYICVPEPATLGLLGLGGLVALLRRKR